MNRTPPPHRRTRSRILSEKDQQTIRAYTAMFQRDYPTTSELEPPADSCSCNPDNPDDKTADDDADEWD